MERTVSCYGVCHCGKRGMSLCRSASPGRKGSGNEV